MINESLAKELKDLIGSCCNSRQIELIDLSFRQEGNKLILTVLADRIEGKITLGECALLNRQLGNLLEEKNIIGIDYILEVSSPGLDRCLKTNKDFLRCLNKEVVFFLNDLVNGKCQWQGIVQRADENSVFIDRPAGHGLASDSQSHCSGQILEIPLIKINKAKLVI